MSSRPSSKFLSRPSVGDVVCTTYDLLTAADQTINPIKSSSSTTQPYENEAAVKTFQNAVSALLTMALFGFDRLPPMPQFKKSLASYNEPSLVVSVPPCAVTSFFLTQPCKLRSRRLPLMRSCILTR